MRIIAALLALLALVVGCGSGEETRVPKLPPAAVARVVAAGDIASCGTDADEATAALARRLAPYAILTLGDNAYPDGSSEDFDDCYGPGWGKFVAKTYPTPGNHDYDTEDATGYFAYFGDHAPEPYYSLDLGQWHVVSLNSEIGAESGSAQERWLRADLERDHHRCELLYWHRPRWSGSRHGSDEGMQALWETAYEEGVDLVLSGHDHNYQRFRPLDADGNFDPRFGIRQIVAGTGGGGKHYELEPIANRAAADSTTYGVLVLVLRAASYDLRFAPADGEFRDSLRDAPCHGAPPGS
ncbi:MAG: metallophosphoesterase [Thermoleophilia bacterium]|nr:metallophosphoesterase [Thermoleophilia bacterium]